MDADGSQIEIKKQTLIQLIDVSHKIYYLDMRS